MRGFFQPDLFLDYIRYFVLSEADGDALIKKIACYHQFHGVREAVRVTLIASATEEGARVKEERATYGPDIVPGSRKAGVFWHTQGSGKSLSMCCYAGKLLQQPEMNNPTLVVVTARNDLDGQLYQQFCAAKDLLRQTPEQAESREQLREMLGARQSGGIIFTTIQKFSLESQESDHPVLCTRSNVVVITDEAHRSQYGTKAKLVDVKDRTTKEVIGKKYVFGYAKHMRDALPGASFIGFTGTPIEQADANTLETFGGYVSIYDIEDAKEDKATVPIYYESRLAKLDINRAEIDALNKDVEEVIEDEEDVSGAGIDQEQVGGAGEAGRGEGTRGGDCRRSGGALRDADERAGREGDDRGDVAGHLREPLRRDYQASAAVGGIKTAERQRLES
ncbi:MAG TPA: DEAD/DEAH box helicase family protein [Chthoniobacteraceae bacterium]